MEKKQPQIRSAHEKSPYVDRGFFRLRRGEIKNGDELGSETKPYLGKILSFSRSSENWNEYDRECEPRQKEQRRTRGRERCQSWENLGGMERGGKTLQGFISSFRLVGGNLAVITRRDHK
jgi:hypothetical protein